MTNGVIDDVRIALGSVAPIPLRLKKLEAALVGRNPQLLAPGGLGSLVTVEIQPIADIRSTEEYRAAVAANLVAEFLRRLRDGAVSA
jgi:CO/xanthine dehydrogenase FAD-binding subunit